ncbi:MAG: hypothetical protein A2580_09205 [Hydrogenophilales bacterium RIFOXYD1_FULL_62_11]|nr:MAG: hypothetical protein A2580_09205 [Hydrogenophilales bacterium RIFOXYD1_FULL_62_11]
MQQQEHGEKGHINVLIRDQDSEITSYGRHCRLLVFKDVETGLITIREDIKHGLPESSEADRQKVAKGGQRMHPRNSKLVHVSSERYQSAIGHESIEHTYVIARNGVKDSDAVLAITVGGRWLKFLPHPMRSMPSDKPEHWLRFQLQHVPGTELSEQDQNRIQRFMRLHKTEALIRDGKHYTLAGGLLAYCDPTAIH